MSIKTRIFSQTALGLILALHSTQVLAQGAASTISGWYQPQPQERPQPSTPAQTIAQNPQSNNSDPVSQDQSVNGNANVEVNRREFKVPPVPPQFLHPSPLTTITKNHPILDHHAQKLRAKPQTTTLQGNAAQSAAQSGAQSNYAAYWRQQQLLQAQNAYRMQQSAAQNAFRLRSQYQVGMPAQQPFRGSYGSTGGPPWGVQAAPQMPPGTSPFQPFQGATSEPLGALGPNGPSGPLGAAGPAGPGGPCGPAGPSTIGG